MAWQHLPTHKPDLTSRMWALNHFPQGYNHSHISHLMRGFLICPLLRYLLSCSVYIMQYTCIIYKCCVCLNRCVNSIPIMRKWGKHGWRFYTGCNLGVNLRLNFTRCKHSGLSVIKTNRKQANMYSRDGVGLENCSGLFHPEQPTGTQPALPHQCTSTHTSP